MDISFLQNTEIFRNATENEVTRMLEILQAKERNFKKGTYIHNVGDNLNTIGIVINGSVTIEFDDIYGKKTILAHLGKGNIFAESYACLPNEEIIVSVVANEACRILFLKLNSILDDFSPKTPLHYKIMKNLLLSNTNKNLLLSKKIQHTAPKQIRDRLLSFLSEQVIKNNSHKFTIPFDRQQLADYLGVDRSAMSNELSKMKKDGIIIVCNKNKFELNENAEIY